MNNEKQAIQIKANKNYISNLIYYAAFYTRHQRSLFKDENNQKLFMSSLDNYLEKNDIKILSTQYNKSLVVLEILAPPTLSPTEIVFNIKKQSARNLIDANKELLQGEHAIWTRQYAISDTSDMAIKLLHSKD